MEKLGKRFDVGKTAVDRKFIFNGCEIKTNEDTGAAIRLSMNYYMEKLEEIELSKARRSELEGMETDQELTDYR